MERKTFLKNYFESRAAFVFFNCAQGSIALLAHFACDFGPAFYGINQQVFKK
jgi:hypothetical protein